MNTKTILIVEDDDDIRESLREAFEDNGYHVRCAANGLEGLQSLQRDAPPCVVLLDLIMPVMSGCELYQQMRADPKLAAIPVVVSTSDPSRAPAGATTLKKPVDLPTVLTTIGTIC